MEATSLFHVDDANIECASVARNSEKSQEVYLQNAARDSGRHCAGFSCEQQWPNVVARVVRVPAGMSALLLLLNSSSTAPIITH